MRFSGIVIGLASAAMMLGTVACSGDGKDANPTPKIAMKTPDGSGGSSGGGGAATSQATKAATKEPQGGGDTAAGDTVKVNMLDNKFEPKDFKVQAGKTYTIALDNQGTAVHNMHVLSQAAEGKDFASELMINPKTQSKFTVTFKKKGTLKFQCEFHVPDMVGTITVQ